MTQTKKAFLYSAVSVALNIIILLVSWNWYPALLPEFYLNRDIIILSSVVIYCIFMSVFIGNKHASARLTMLLLICVYATDMLILNYNINTSLASAIRKVLMFLILCWGRKPIFRKKALIGAISVFSVITLADFALNVYFDSLVISPTIDINEGFLSFMSLLTYSQNSGIETARNISQGAVNSIADIVIILLLICKSGINKKAYENMKFNFNCKCPGCKEKVLPFKNKIFCKSDNEIVCPDCGCKCAANTGLSAIVAFICLIAWAVIVFSFQMDLIASLIGVLILYVVIALNLPYKINRQD